MVPGAHSDRRELWDLLENKVSRAFQEWGDHRGIQEDKVKGETREITEFVEFPENKERAEGLEGMVDLARQAYMAKREILANAVKMVPRVSLAAQELKAL